MVATLPYRLRTDWVVAWADPGLNLPVAVLAAATGRTGEGRPGADDLQWLNPDRSALVAAWQRDPVSSGGAWHQDEGGVTIVRGQLRRRGQPWIEPGSWAADHAARRPVDPQADPFDGLVGDGTIVSLRGDGTGVVAADRLGAASVFHARGEGYEVFASNAELAGRLARPDGHPQRSALASAWLVHTGYVIGRDTEYEGVTTVAPGSLIGLRCGRPPVLSGASPWDDSTGLSTRTDDLLDRVAESVVDQLTGGLTLGEEPFLDLTGGKDSRLVLAMAKGAGLLDQFRLRTVGPPDLEDVQVAAGVARYLGAAHVTGFDPHPIPGDFPAKVGRFVAATGGTVSAWAMKLRHLDPGAVRISGIVGEALRADLIEREWLNRSSGRAGHDTGAMAELVVSRRRTGSANFLRGEIIDLLDDRVREEITGHPTVTLNPDRALAGFFLRHRGARYGGPLLDLDRDHRVWALFDIHAVRAAHALPPELRRGEWVHYELIRRVDPKLARFVFDGPGWAGGFGGGGVPVPAVPEMQAPEPKSATGGPTPSDRGPRAAGVATANAKPLDLMFHALGRPNVERRSFFESVVADRENPIWEVVDYDRVHAAVSGLDDLSPKQRRELYAVGTGAVWLSTHEGSADSLLSEAAAARPNEPVVTASSNRRVSPGDETSRWRRWRTRRG